MDYELLGMRIRESRKANNFSIKQLASQLSFSHQHLGNIERGMAHPSIDLLVEISNLLKVPLDYLLQDSLDFTLLNHRTTSYLEVQNYLIRQQINLLELQKKIQRH